MSGFNSSPFEENGNYYSVAVDMNYFHPSEMSVKVIDNAVVVVEAKHKERQDDQFGCISRHFLHRYRLPNNVDPTSITSDLSDKGILTVTATKVDRGKVAKTANDRSHSPKLNPMNDHDEETSHDESDFIVDNYEHREAGLFYTVTRIIEGGRGGPELDRFETGCDCGDSGGDCTSESGCSCLAYGPNYTWNGTELLLDDAKFGDSPVFECHFRCSCFDRLKTTGTSCRNRRVQLGPRQFLAVFDAGRKGWGLKTEREIARGAFVCEYAGEVIGLEEAKRRQEEQARRGEPNYVFVLREHSGGVLRAVTCVDPSRVGNVGRYINHSCSPNAAVVAVRVNDRVPWLCVFALRDILPGEEISYDYGGESPGEKPTGNLKECLCGTDGCRRFLPFANL